MSPFNKTTQQKMSVCEAFGLHYWADHPEAGRMWAVDDNQQTHVVRWYRSKGLAALQRESSRRLNSAAYPYRPIETYATYDAGERIAVAV